MYTHFRMDDAALYVFVSDRRKLFLRRLLWLAGSDVARTKAADQFQVGPVCVKH
jgi:hypothetical protein